MNRVKALREAFGRTLRDVEADTGVTRSTLQRIESEIGEPSYYAIERLADYYHVTIDYLMMHKTKSNKEIFNDEARKMVEARLEIQRLTAELPSKIIENKLKPLTEEPRLPKQRNDDMRQTRKGIKPRIKFKAKIT